MALMPKEQDYGRMIGEAYELRGGNGRFRADDLPWGKEAKLQTATYGNG